MPRIRRTIKVATPLDGLVNDAAAAAKIGLRQARKAVVHVLGEVLRDLDGYVASLKDTNLRDAARVIRVRMEVALDRLGARSDAERRQDKAEGIALVGGAPRMRGA